MTDIEARLRATLAEHARQAPDGTDLAERILTEIDTPGRVLRPRRGRGWGTWTMPLLTAAAVAAVVATVVGIGQVHHTASPPPPGVSHIVSPTPSPRTSPPTTAAPSPTTTPPTQSAPHKAAPNPAVVTGFHALDLTFVNDTVGWAVGPADCLHGSGTCTAIFHTTDGRTWRGIPGAEFNVPGVQACTAPCVTHIRFANATVGYAYSSDALFMTVDGGAHWALQPGRGAEALETLDNNVIRLVASSPAGCPGPCNVHVETAPIGTAAWTTVHLRPGDIDPAGVQLARSGPDAYLLATGRTAGGASNATSTLYVSTDDGATWAARGEPCPQTGGESDSTALAAGAARRVAVLCVPRDRSGTQRPRAIFSTDAGVHFPTSTGPLPFSATALLAGDPTTELLAGGTALYRHTPADGGWQPVPTVTGSVTFVGFESPTVGRVVTDSGRKIWTTADGGRSWASVEFP